MRLTKVITESFGAVKNIENFKSMGGFTIGDPKKQNVSKHVSFMVSSHGISDLTIEPLNMFDQIKYPHACLCGTRLS